METPKLPSAFMQGLIAILLLANFSLMLLGPTLFPGYKPPSEALIQTLVNLVILAVGYYLGSSQGSARKDELNAAQQDKALTALAPPVAPDPLPPKSAAPVQVAVVNADPVPVTLEPNAPAADAAPPPAVPK